MRSALSIGVGAVLASCLMGVPACGSSNNGGSGVNGSGVNGSGANGSGANGSGANGSGANGSGANGSANGSGANGSANAGTGPSLDLGGGTGEAHAGSTGSGSSDPREVCDGLDNDNDGIIDNVDKNNDGVCDCLLIATLGVKGGSGQGDVFAAWLTARSDAGATDLADQMLTPELLAKYQVIVAQDVHAGHPYADSEVKALSDWVNNGGGFMTLIGYSSAGEAHNVNLLLASFGMSYTDQQILQKSGSNTIPITMWTPHPVDSGVVQVGVDNGYPVQGMGTTIATGGGFDVAKVQDVGKGHVFLWGDEWITYNSEWNDHPDYQVQLLWLNAIKWLTVAGNCQVAIPPNPPK